MSISFSTISVDHSLERRADRYHSRGGARDEVRLNRPERPLPTKREVGATSSWALSRPVVEEREGDQSSAVAHAYPNAG